MNQSALKRLFPAGQLLTNPVELLTYEVDAALDRGHPEGVILIHSSEDVIKVVRWAAGQSVVLTARGAGTGLSGGAVAHQGGLILEFSRCNRILEFDREGRSVVVEPGLVNLKLDEFVRRSGFYYPPDPASGRSATLGGNVAENAGGPHCFKYGVTTNYVTGLEAVLADGSLVHFGGRALDPPEYDFTGLLNGSEGTLAILTKIEARLLRYPPAVKTLMAAFDTLDAAGKAVSAVIARGLVPATLEMMDQRMMTIIEDYAHAGLPVQAGAALIVEVDGYPQSLETQMSEVSTLLQANGAWGLRLARSAEERETIWYGRKSAAGAMARLSPSYYLLDGTVPRSRLAQALADITAVCEANELRVAYVFHAGDGNLHPFILIDDPTRLQLMQRVLQTGQAIMKICVDLGGSVTGEHGVGLEKRRFMPLMYSDDELAVMLDVKQVFDPHGLFNPGKIFPETFSAPEASPRTQALHFDTALQSFHPQTGEQAAQALRAWTLAGKSVRLVGAGTKSAWLSAAERTLHTGKLAGIERLALEDQYVTVRAGTRLTDLQTVLAEQGMLVPLVSPWPQATLGGMLAANANAPLRMRYGGLRDLLLDVKVALADGRLLHLGRPVVKNVAGYDLPKLFVGAQGTLGLITEATFKLAPLPRRCASLVVPVEDLAQGLQWGALLLPVCLTASALLLCRGVGGLSGAPWSLVYTAEGFPEDVAAELEQATALLRPACAAPLSVQEGLSGSQVWADWCRAADPLWRASLPVRELAAFLSATCLPPEQSLLACIADLANGAVYWSGLGSEQSVRRQALARGGYAILFSASNAEAGHDPWGYRPEGLNLMLALKARWNPGGLLNPQAFLV